MPAKAFKSVCKNYLYEEVENDGNMVWSAFGSISGMGHVGLAVGRSDGLLGDKVKYFETQDGDDHTISWSNYASGDFLNSTWNWRHGIFDFS